MRDDDLTALSRELDQLRRLLVITWIVDGKSRAQVAAFCDALLLPSDAKDELIAMFEARQPKPADVQMVRAAGNVELAIEMTKKRGLA